jgi:methylenetetrahydrofolate dehydrogenase (NADP+)/methenyltetrahydrofolate cyclohydrolase
MPVYQTHTRAIGSVDLSVSIIDGKETAARIYSNLEGRIAALKEKKVIPNLTVILVGEDPASKVYVGMKGKAAERIGIGSETIRLPATTPETELLDTLHKLNADPTVHGILVQMPLPDHISESKVIETIDPSKDVDGFHPVNRGKLMAGQDCFLPCTPAGIQQLLIRNGHSPVGKHLVVVGRSGIVGLPFAVMMMHKRQDANATVTLCHTGTQDLRSHTRQADILVVASGRPNTITGDMVKEGTVVIDVGVNRVDDASKKRGYRLVGDVDFDDVQSKVKAITPVPGGVGPMTIAMLMVNTVKAAEQQVP